MVVFERGKLQFCNHHQLLQYCVAVRGNTPALPSPRGEQLSLELVMHIMWPQGELDQFAVLGET